MIGFRGDSVAGVVDALDQLIDSHGIGPWDDFFIRGKIVEMGIETFEGFHPSQGANLGAKDSVEGLGEGCYFGGGFRSESPLRNFGGHRMVSPSGEENIIGILLKNRRLAVIDSLRQPLSLPLKRMEIISFPSDWYRVFISSIQG